MPDEIVPLAEPEGIQTIEPDKELPVELPATDEAVDNDEPTVDEADEFVDVERGGKTYKVPKALEGEFLMQADYTRKRQADAETAKQLESREAEIKQRAEATEAELDARAELRTVNKSLEYYSQFTQEQWNAAEEADPYGTGKAWRAFELLRHQKADLESTVSKTQNERTEKAQQDLAKRVQETIAFAQKDIPGFKPELTDKLVKFVTTDLGIEEDRVKANWSPKFYKMAYLANIGAETLKRQAAAPRVAQPTEPIAPLQTVTAKAQPAARMSLEALAKAGRMDEYHAARKAGRVR